MIVVIAGGAYIRFTDSMRFLYQFANKTFTETSPIWQLQLDEFYSPINSSPNCLQFQNSKSIRILHQLLDNLFSKTPATPIETRCGFLTNSGSKRFRSQIVNKCFAETLAISTLQIDTFCAPMCWQMFPRNACTFTTPNRYFFGPNLLTNISKKRLHFHNSKSMSFAPICKQTLHNNACNFTTPNLYVFFTNCFKKFLTTTLAFQQFPIDTFSAQICWQNHCKNCCHFTTPNRCIFLTNCLTNVSPVRLRLQISKSRRTVKILFNKI